MTRPIGYTGNCWNDFSGWNPPSHSDVSFTRTAFPWPFWPFLKPFSGVYMWSFCYKPWTTLQGKDLDLEHAITKVEPHHRAAISRNPAALLTVLHFIMSQNYFRIKNKKKKSKNSWRSEITPCSINVFSTSSTYVHVFLPVLSVPMEKLLHQTAAITFGRAKWLSLVQNIVFALDNIAHHPDIYNWKRK